MTSNLKIWDKVRRVPPEHLKGFKRGGGFTGTAIKPMWSIHAMTEQFGACGGGWGIDEPKFQVVQGTNHEVMVYCYVSVWHGSRENKVFGTGGDKVVSHIRANDQYNRPERWENDDEAFKKAFTDAVTNALKFIGVGADIHMGLWDGNKYVDETPEAKPAAKAAPKAAARPEYTKISEGIRSIRDNGMPDELKKWFNTHKAVIASFDPSWKAGIIKEFDDAGEEMAKRLAVAAMGAG